MSYILVIIIFATDLHHLTIPPLHFILTPHTTKNAFSTERNKLPPSSYDELQHVATTLVIIRDVYE